MLFKTLTLIPKNLKFEKSINFPIIYNWRIRNLTIWKISSFILPFGQSIFYNLIKLLNIMVIQIIYKFFSLSSIMKVSNNSSFVILVFAILKFGNIEDRSTFRRSKFWPPPNWRPGCKKRSYARKRVERLSKRWRHTSNFKIRKLNK